MKLIRPPDSSTAHLTLSSESICWSRASAASSSGVIRSLLEVLLDHLAVLDEDQRLGLENRANPRELPAHVRGGKRHRPEDSDREDKPVTDRSFCVMPCWIRSPITISSMRSNGWSELSSRRPMSLVREEDEAEGDDCADDDVHLLGKDTVTCSGRRCRQERRVVVELDVL